MKIIMPRACSALILITVLIGCEDAKSPQSVNHPDRQSQEVAERAVDSRPEDWPLELLKLSGDNIADGWIELFDGETLFGWKANSELNWRVEDGVIIADEGQPGLLQTTSRFADFEFR